MREQIVAGNIYHVLNRGVDKRDIFLDDSDHLRFIHDLFVFNDVSQLQNTTHFFKNSDCALYRTRKQRWRDPLVEILAFCLMPNHYHLLLRPRHDDAISHFMKRLSMGYSHYFNNRYNRSGTLYEGKYKSIAITEDAHFIHIPYYIHLNPLDLHTPSWRERNIKNHGEAMQFLEGYRWSSLLDYFGTPNFPSVTHRDFILDLHGQNSRRYRSDLESWLRDCGVSAYGKDMLLE